MSAPYEIEVVLVDDSTTPSRWARVARVRHGATVNRRTYTLDGAQIDYHPPVPFDDYERALACVNRWLRGEEWQW